MGEIRQGQEVCMLVYQALSWMSESILIVVLLSCLFQLNSRECC